jgi:hypothetical protein
MDKDSKLSKKTCMPCNKNIPALKGDGVKQMVKDLGNQRIKQQFFLKI